MKAHRNFNIPPAEYGELIRIATKAAFHGCTRRRRRSLRRALRGVR